MNPRTVRLWLAAACVLALVLSPFLVRGDMQLRKVREANQRQIASLSNGDRERLDRNYAEYRQLSPPEKAHVDEFHHDLTASAKERQRQLEHTMEVYLDWARTLPPYQREALMKETDSQKRLDLVREFLEQQSDWEAQRLAFVEMGWLPPGARRAFRDAPLLSPEELASLMVEIEDRQWRYFSVQEQERLSQLQGIERYVQLLKLLKEKSAGTVAMHGMVRQVFVEKLRDSSAAAYLKKLQADAGDSQFEEFLPRLGWMVILAKSLIHEAISQQRQSEIPSDQVLSELLHSLPPEEQDRLLSLEAVEFRGELLRLHRQKSTPINPREIAGVFLPSPEERGRFEENFRRIEGRGRSWPGGDPRPGRPPEFRPRRPDGRDGDSQDRPDFGSPRFPRRDYDDDERHDRRGDQQP